MTWGHCSLGCARLASRESNTNSTVSTECHRWLCSVEFQHSWISPVSGAPKAYVTQHEQRDVLTPGTCLVWVTLRPERTFTPHSEKFAPKVKNSLNVRGHVRRLEFEQTPQKRTLLTSQSRSATGWKSPPFCSKNVESMCHLFDGKPTLMCVTLFLQCSPVSGRNRYRSEIRKGVRIHSPLVSTIAPDSMPPSTRIYFWKLHKTGNWMDLYSDNGQVNMERKPELLTTGRITRHCTSNGRNQIRPQKAGAGREQWPVPSQIRTVNRGGMHRNGLPAFGNSGQTENYFTDVLAFKFTRCWRLRAKRLVIPIPNSDHSKRTRLCATLICSNH